MNDEPSDKVEIPTELNNVSVNVTNNLFAEDSTTKSGRPRTRKRKKKKVNELKQAVNNTCLNWRKTN